MSLFPDFVSLFLLPSGALSSSPGTQTLMRPSSLPVMKMPDWYKTDDLIITLEDGFLEVKFDHGFNFFLLKFKILRHGFASKDDPDSTKVWFDSMSWWISDM